MSTNPPNPDEEAVPNAVVAATAKVASGGASLRVKAPVNPPVRRGRPPLTPEERLRREEWDADKKATRALARSRGLAAAGRSSSHSLDIKRLQQEAAPKKRRRAKRGDAEEAPPIAEALAEAVPTAPLSIAQRVLGVGFGEASEALEDAVPLCFRAGPLPENVKRFIVIRNACNVPPRETITQVKEAFGLTVTAPQIARYDPTKAAGQTLRDDYKRLYAEMKREAQVIVDCLGVGDQGWRMTALHNLCVNAREEGDDETAFRILKLVHREECARMAKEQAITPKQRALREKLRNTRPEDLPPIYARQDPPWLQQGGQNTPPEAEDDNSLR